MPSSVPIEPSRMTIAVVGGCAIASLLVVNLVTGPAALSGPTDAEPSRTAPRQETLAATHATMHEAAIAPERRPVREAAVAPAPPVDAPSAPEPIEPQEARSAAPDLDAPDLDAPTEAMDKLVVRFGNSGQSRVSRRAKRRLRRLARRLAKQSGARVRIEGHTDRRGSEEFNLELGHRRADAVAATLVAAGVDRERIEIVSKGELDPVTSKGNFANRRVEVFFPSRSSS